uniref:Cysteine-type peptidase n=1 Tax=Solanum tuberosum TaxID=4113 RepID=M1CGB3_SOLTU
MAIDGEEARKFAIATIVGEEARMSAIVAVIGEEARKSAIALEREQSSIYVYMLDRSSGSSINISNYGEEYRKKEESPINVLFHGYGHYDIGDNFREDSPEVRRIKACYLVTTVDCEGLVGPRCFLSSMFQWLARLIRYRVPVAPA